MRTHFLLALKKISGTKKVKRVMIATAQNMIIFYLKIIYASKICISPGKDLVQFFYKWDLFWTLVWAGDCTWMASTSSFQKCSGLWRIPHQFQSLVLVGREPWPLGKYRDTMWLTYITASTVTATVTGHAWCLSSEAPKNTLINLFNTTHLHQDFSIKIVH